MTAPDDSRDDPPDALSEFEHDIQNCHHVITIGLDILTTARGNDALFAEVTAAMAKSNEKAVQLIRDHVRETRVTAA